MSQSPASPGSADDLQFNTVEPSDAAGVARIGQTCAACGQPISSTYYAVGDQMLCPSCTHQIKGPPPGTKVGRLTKASLMGVGAGLVGAAIWFAIRRMTNLQLGIVAILVGFMVGKAVRTGSGNRGGRAYQVLAVIITYCCIAANYMPDIFEALFADLKNDGAIVVGEGGIEPQDVAQNPQPQQPDPAAQPAAPPAGNPLQGMGPYEMITALAILLVLMFGIALAVPFMDGVQNLIGLLIIGFALWEAWKFNSRVDFAVTGPYELNPEPAT